MKTIEEILTAVFLYVIPSAVVLGAYFVGGYIAGYIVGSVLGDADPSFGALCTGLTVAAAVLGGIVVSLCWKVCRNRQWACRVYKRSEN